MSRVAQALVPLLGAPSMASALDGLSKNVYGGAPFAGVDTSVASASVQTYSASAGRRAATISISGKYSDPQHPGCLRKISKSGEFLFVSGADEDGKKFNLNGKYSEDKGVRSVLIDFSPKGGPKDVVASLGFGPGGLGDIVLKFPDGNTWSKI